ncbi:MAG TPA: rod-binding protein [Sphingomonas sp.]|jgi:flagellar protein FlgJ
MTSIGPIGGVGADSSRTASRDNLAKAGDRFEAVFTGMMLASMRKASLAEPLFSSKAIDTFRDMQDKQTAQAMAEHSPIGIGRAMTEFLSRSQPDLNPDVPSKAE